MLRKVRIISRTADGGGQYAVVVRDVLGTVYERPLTRDQYLAGTKKMRLLGETVLNAYGDHVYDTFTGKLEDGCCAEESPGVWLVKRDRDTRQVTLRQRAQPGLNEDEDRDVTRLSKVRP